MTLDKQVLEDRAEDYFDKYPTQDTLFATSDGMFFSEKHQREAKQHARKSGKRIYMFSRREAENSLFPSGEPEMRWTKAQIVTFLQQMGIEHKEDDNKTKLIATWHEWSEAQDAIDPLKNQNV